MFLTRYSANKTLALTEGGGRRVRVPPNGRARVVVAAHAVFSGALLMFEIRWMFWAGTACVETTLFETRCNKASRDVESLQDDEDGWELVDGNPDVDTRTTSDSDKKHDERSWLLGRTVDAARVDLPVYAPANTETFATYGSTDQGDGKEHVFAMAGQCCVLCILDTLMIFQCKPRTVPIRNLAPWTCLFRARRSRVWWTLSSTCCRTRTSALNSAPVACWRS